MGYEFLSGPQDAQLEGWLKNLYNTHVGGGYGKKLDKHLLQKFESGADVSDYGQLNPIRQYHAANRREIGDSYLYGGNALIAGAGGEQASIMNSMRDTAMEKDREAEGRETGQAVTDLYNTTNDRFQSNRLQRKGMELGAQQGAVSGMLNYYGQRHPVVYKKGFWDNFSQVLGALGQGAQGAGSIMAGM